MYLGDSARVPYGIKSLETVRRFALQCAAFLGQFNPKLIVAACNTASAAAVAQLEAFCDAGVVDVIRPGAAAAAAATDGPIGVIGTAGTISSGAYERAIESVAPGRAVFTAGCPLLVPIIEEGRPDDDPIVLSALGDYLHDLQRSRLGALILGCTHYPLLSAAIGKLMGPDVTLINSGAAAAGQVVEMLGGEGGGGNRVGTGELRCYTTDNAERFAELGERFAGRPIDRVAHVDSDDLEAQAVSG